MSESQVIAAILGTILTLTTGMFTWFIKRLDYRLSAVEKNNVTRQEINEFKLRQEKTLEMLNVLRTDIAVYRERMNSCPNVRPNRSQSDTTVGGPHN